MKKEKVNLGELTFMGVTTRTNNKDEMNPETAKIGALVKLYWDEKVASKFKNRSNAGLTYLIYTNYASDEHGEYTCFIGETVSDLADQDTTKYTPLTILPSTYQKFTTDSGKMPDIIIKAWQDIWRMTSVDLAGKRKYKADFEVYDLRARDINNAVVDIYVGIE